MILRQPISRDELQRMAAEMFGDFVKAVADVGRARLALHAELHADLEAELLEDGAAQPDLWGFNLYPDAPAEQFIEYDSLINIRPSRGNKSRGVEDEAVRNAIAAVVTQWIRP